MSTVSRWVLGADLHYPKWHESTFNAMLEVIRGIKPVGFIFQGDQFDNEEISHHTQGKPYYRNTGAFKANTDSFISKVLDPLEKALPKKSEKVWIIGNHDNWEFELIEKQPELEGMIERPLLLKLMERDWQIVPMGLHKWIGDLKVIHGETIRGIGANAARKHVEDHCCNVFAAHTHAPQTFTKVLPGDVKTKWMGGVNAILGNTNPVYTRNRANGWTNGFAVVEIFGEHGFSNPYTVIMKEGKFAYGGRLYGK